MSGESADRLGERSCDCHMTLIVGIGYFILTIIPKLKYLREGMGDLIPECNYSTCM